jgi:putative hemolysin
MEAMELSNNLGDVTRFIRGCRHSRIPVYEGSPDHVVGIFYIKDLMRWLAGPGTQGAQKPFELKAIIRPALFVPETKTIRELLAELLAKKVHIAMVADEYGGTSGLVTFEDIVEEVFGEIRDEYEVEEETSPEVTVAAGERVAEIDGRAYIEDANEQIRPLGVELPEGEDYDTVGGLVVTTLGRIPGAGETARFGHALLTVLEAEPTRVSRVRLEVREPEPAEPESLPAGEAEIVTPRRDGARVE